VNPPQSRRATALVALAAVTFATAALAHASEPGGDCSPPRTRIALVALHDATDRSWAAWSGLEPARLVTVALSDSLRHLTGRDVELLTLPGGDLARPVDDEDALAAALRAHAELVVTGALTEFTYEDRRQGGRLSRWGVGPLDARSRAHVRVQLRVLDARDGGVVLESTVDRERTGRGTASVSRRESGVAIAPAGPLADALDEVLASLAVTLGRRLDERWHAVVASATTDDCTFDAGVADGVFVGERLDVWRPGIETWDEDLVRLVDELPVGAIVVVALEGQGRSRARLVEGEVRAGDRVRPCASPPAPSVSLRH